MRRSGSGVYMIHSSDTLILLSGFYECPETLCGEVSCRTLVYRSTLNRGDSYGISTYLCSNWWITGNYIVNCRYGIQVEQFCHHIVARYNCIMGNGEYGVYNSHPSTTVDARGNWWGDASGPRHSGNPGGSGDGVSDGVDYSEWLERPIGLYGCSLIDLKYTLVNLTTGAMRDATVVYGDSNPHGELYGSRTIDVVGGDGPSSGPVQLGCS